MYTVNRKREHSESPVPKEYTVYPTENGQHPHRLTLRHLTQPLPACSCGTRQYTALPVRLYNGRQSRRGEVG